MSRKGLPVVEIFGPTLQGEGAQAGLKTNFIRFGYCDSKCVWCDSKHAVDPQQVKANAKWMTEEDILVAVSPKDAPDWITFSGGNPAMHDLGNLVDLLQLRGHKINVETQGTLSPEWLAKCDMVTVSPKPPSSKELTDIGKLQKVLDLVGSRAVLKVVVFDDIDYDWAKVIHKLFKTVPFYMSVGTSENGFKILPPRMAKIELLEKYTWLAEKVSSDPSLPDVAVLPQLHVLLWGDKLGV